MLDLLVVSQVGSFIFILGGGGLYWAACISFRGWTFGQLPIRNDTRDQSTDRIKADFSLPVTMSNPLKSLLRPHNRPELCNSVLPTLLDCISEIAKTLRKSQHVSLAGTANTFGDGQ